MYAFNAALFSIRNARSVSHSHNIYTTPRAYIRFFPHKIYNLLRVGRFCTTVGLEVVLLIALVILFFNVLLYMYEDTYIYEQDVHNKKKRRF